MNNQIRWNITLRIWVAALIIGALMTQPGYEIMSIAVATALLATLFVWADGILHRLGIPALVNKAQSSDTSDKAYKLAVLLEMMDEDEREEFKHRLKNDLMGGGDSESLSIESLITEKRKRG
ncbi:MAG: hypothetical protein MUE54_02135 [Anaerolineae bacterium]|jgi:hypothetical protein|nr:hypothetical protein [Anaerolineae bacterium]